MGCRKIGVEMELGGIMQEEEKKGAGFRGRAMGRSGV